MKLTEFTGTSSGEVRITQSLQTIVLKIIGQNYDTCSDAVVNVSIARVTGENITLFKDEKLRTIVDTIGVDEKLIQQMDGYLLFQLPISPASLALLDGDVLSFKITALPQGLGDPETHSIHALKVPFFTDDYYRIDKKVVARDLIEQTLNVSEYTNVTIPVGTVDSIVLNFVNRESVEYDTTVLMSMTADYHDEQSISNTAQLKTWSTDNVSIPLEGVATMTIKKPQTGHVNLHFGIKPELDA